MVQQVKETLAALSVMHKLSAMASVERDGEADSLVAPQPAGGRQAERGFGSISPPHKGACCKRRTKPWCTTLATTHSPELISASSSSPPHTRCRTGA